MHSIMMWHDIEGCYCLCDAQTLARWSMRKGGTFAVLEASHRDRAGINPSMGEALQRSPTPVGRRGFDQCSIAVYLHP
jgi:hypothetical protein